MLAVLALNLSVQMFLIFVGFSLLQMTNTKNKVSLFYDLPYAFGVGIVFLYIAAYPLVRFDLSPDYWHWYILLFGAAIIIFAGYFYVKADTNKVISAKWQLRWFDWLLILLIIIKLALVIFGNLLNPVVDSDAVDAYRHVGLAKYIFMQYPLSATEAYKAEVSTELSLPIWHAWSSMFQDRWYDSVATFHYVLAFIGALIMAGIIGIRQQIKPTFVLLAVFIIVSIPIAAMHIVRPGFADLMVMYFFMLAIAVLFAILDDKIITKSNVFLLVVAVLGMAMSKLEGIIWAIWAVIVVASWCFHYYKNVDWKTILLYQGVVLVVGFAGYLLVADWVFTTVNLPIRISWLFDLRYNPESFDRFFGYMYISGGQGLIWWIFSIFSVVVLLKSKSQTDKTMVLYTLILMLGLFHFANFTANIGFTLNGTNVGRFLLQLSPIILISYYSLIKNYHLNTK